MQYKDLLIPLSILVLAGAICAGLGQLAQAGSYGDNAAMIAGQILMVIGTIGFLISCVAAVRDQNKKR